MSFFLGIGLLILIMALGWSARALIASRLGDAIIETVTVRVWRRLITTHWRPR